MGLLDTFRGQQYKNELESLQEKYNNLEKLLTPEMQDVIRLQELISELEHHKTTIENHIKEQEEKYQQIVSEQQASLSGLEAQIRLKREELITFDDTILAQEFGLYSPRYDFTNAEQYKVNLDRVRNHQKEYIKDGTAFSGNKDWTINGDHKKGQKLIKDMQKLLIRAFNIECDDTINKIKYNNFEMSIKKIQSSAATISKLTRCASLIFRI